MPFGNFSSNSSLSSSILAASASMSFLFFAHMVEALSGLDGESLSCCAALFFFLLC